MKKNNLAKIVFLAVTFVLLLGASLGVLANEATASAEIVSKNVYYGETWNLMYAVQAENLAEGDTVVVKLYDSENQYVATIKPQTDDEGNVKLETINEKECYVFIARQGVAAQDIAEVFYAQPEVVNGDTVVAAGSTCKYSVLEYLYERLYTSTTATDAQKNLYTTLVAYAKAAEAVLRADRAETDLISNFAYVQVVDGTVNGAAKGLYKKGDILTNLVATNAPADGIVTVWKGYDAAGSYFDYYIDEVEIELDFIKLVASELPAANSTLTIADALALGASYSNSSYTPYKYYVTGTVVEISDETNGNLMIADENGTVFSVLGTFNATGDTPFASLETKPVVGDIVTVYGKIGQASGIAHMADGWITEHTITAPVPVEMTIAEALAAEVGTLVTIKGTVASLYNGWDAAYGNCSPYVADEEGNQIIVYRTTVQVNAGDVVTVTGEITQYNGVNQIAQGNTLVIDVDVEAPELDPVNMTIAEALAAPVGTKVIVSGKVTGFYEAWSSYNNCSPYIADADGNEILIYRTTVQVNVGDEVTVTGEIGQYDNVNQIAKGNELVIDVDVEPPVSTTPELTFDAANRTTLTTSQQVWVQNGITLTNDKGASTSSVADYAAPARFYKSSKITVECETAMTKIEFVCNATKYATALANSIAADANYTVTVSGSTVTVTFNEAVTSFVIASLTGGQVRMNSLKAYN